MAYVAAVRNIGSMNKRKAQQLEDYLLNQEIIDSRPVLNLDDLAEEAVARVGVHLEAGTLGAADVRSFVAWVSEVLAAGEVSVSS